MQHPSNNSAYNIVLSPGTTFPVTLTSSSPSSIISIPADAHTLALTVDIGEVLARTEVLCQLAASHINNPEQRREIEREVKALAPLYGWLKNKEQELLRTLGSGPDPVRGIVGPQQQAVARLTEVNGLLVRELVHEQDQLKRALAQRASLLSSNSQLQEALDRAVARRDKKLRRGGEGSQEQRQESAG